MNLVGYSQLRIYTSKSQHGRTYMYIVYRGVATLDSSRHMPIHKFDNYFCFKSLFHFPTEIHMKICSMILWMRLSVGKSGGVL
jgi:hypothetical protein